MPLHYELVYLKGENNINEDSFVADEINKIFCVIDGATGLGGLSGKIAAEVVQETIQGIKSNESLASCIQRANTELGRQAAKELRVQDIHTIPKENRSTCGLAAIKIHNQMLEYVHAGDCMIFIQYKTNQIRCLTYDHLSDLDRVSIDLAHQKIKSKLKEDEDPNEWDEKDIKSLLKQVRQEIQPTLIKNRSKLNTAGGYGIIDGSIEAIDYLEVGSIPIHNASKILLLSDGLQLPADKGTGQRVWSKTAAFAFKHGILCLRDEVLKLENSDRACFKYPRLKYADDKTGILIRLD